MTTSNFLRTTDTSNLAALGGTGGLILDAWPRLHAFLRQAGQPDLATLLAEPVLGGRDGATVRSVAWYSALDGDAVPLAQLGSPQREQATAQLRDRLARLKPYYRHPEIGPLLQRAAVIAHADDIMTVGGQVVLTNWGLAPPAVADSPEALSRHYGATLGRLVGLPPPWEMAAPLPAEDATVIASRPAAPAAAATAAPLAATAATVATAAVLPWYQRPAAWVAGALLLLAVGAIFGLMVRWREQPVAAKVDPQTSRRHDDLLAIQREVNRSLEDQIDRLRGSLRGDVCTIDAPQGLPLSPQAPIAPAEGEKPPAPPPAADGKPTAAVTLAQRLDVATVFVLVPKGEGIGTGTGFFVTPDTIVTNRHVIAGATGGKVFVTGKGLGRLQPVDLIDSTDAGERDYAVLRLKTTATGTVEVLALSDGATKLDPVVAAGFPGFEISLDPKYKALLDGGDRSAVPEVVVSSGEVSVIQPLSNSLPVIAHTAVVSQGNSGGPLVDRCGRVVGINTFIRTDDQSMRQGNYALAASDLIRYLREHNIAVQVATSRCAPPTSSAK